MRLEPPHRARFGGRLRATWLLAAGVLLASASAADEKAWIDVGRRLDVHTLDSRLPHLRFERWLQRLSGPNARIRWETNDCGEATGSPADTARDLPVCVEAMVRTAGNDSLDVAIAIGTMKGGPARRAALHWATATRGDSTASFRSLADLARFARAKR